MSEEAKDTVLDTVPDGSVRCGQYRAIKREHGLLVCGLDWATLENLVRRNKAMGYEFIAVFSRKVGVKQVAGVPHYYDGGVTPNHIWLEYPRDDQKT